MQNGHGTTASALTPFPIVLVGISCPSDITTNIINLWLSFTAVSSGASLGGWDYVPALFFTSVSMKCSSKALGLARSLLCQERSSSELRFGEISSDWILIRRLFSVKGWNSTIYFQGNSDIEGLT